MNNFARRYKHTYYSALSLLSITFLMLFNINAFAEVQIEHAQGVENFAHIPKKIFTYDLATLDTLQALDIEVQGVPKGYLATYLTQYQGDEYMSIGSIFEPDYEVVAASRPDLIVVATRSAKAYPQLSQLAPTIDLTIWGDNYLQQFESSSTKIAKIFDKEAALKQKLASIEKDVEQVNKLAKSAGNALFILTNGGKISAYGKGSRFGWLHDELGLKPVIDNLQATTHGDPISFEFILAANPDWLFVLDRDAVVGQVTGAAQALLDNRLINKTKAAQRNQIVYLNSTNWYLYAGGLTAVTQSVKEVLTALKKES